MDHVTEGVPVVVVSADREGSTGVPAVLAVGEVAVAAAVIRRLSE